MARKNTIEIQVEAKTTKATTALNKLGSTIGGLGKTALKGLAIGGASVAGAAAIAGGALTKMALDAAPLKGVEEAFEGVAEASGKSADDVLAALERGSLGMVRQADLMEKYNKAAMLVNDTFANELPDAMGYLSKVSAATGEDMGYMLDSLVTGVGRLSPMILDNLGIQVDLTAANEAYAASIGKTVDELSKGEKQTALMSQVMEKLEANTAAMPDVAGSAAQNIAALGVKFQNLKDSIGKAVLPALNSVLGIFNRIIDKHGPAIMRTMEKLGAVLEKFFGGLSEAIEGGWPAVGRYLADWAKKFWDWLTGPGGVVERGKAAIADLVAKMGAWLKEHWPDIKAKLLEWAGKFWEWVTGGGGVVAGSGSALQKVLTTITQWLADNWPAISAKLKEWGDRFWLWVSEVAIPKAKEKLSEITDRLNEWAASPDTQGQLTKMGATVGTALVDGVKTLVGAVETWGPVVIDLAGALGKAFTKGIVPAIDTMIEGLVTGFVTGAAEALGIELPPKLTETVADIVSTIVFPISLPLEIKEFASDFKKDLKKLTKFVDKSLGKMWKGVGKDTAKETKKSYKTISKWLSDIADEVKDKFGAYYSEVKGRLKDIYDEIKRKFSDYYSEVKRRLSDIAGEIERQFKGYLDEVKRKLADIYGEIKDRFRDYLDEVKRRLNDIADEIKRQFAAYLDEIKRKLSDIASEIKSRFQEYLDEIKRRLSDIGSEIRAKFQEYLDEIRRKLSDIGSEIQTRFQEYLDEIRRRLSDILSEVQTKWQEIKDAIAAKLSEIVEEIRRKGQEMYDTLKEKLQALANIPEEIRDVLIGIGTAIVARIIDGIRSVTDFADQVATWIGGELAKLVSTVTDWLSRAISIGKYIILKIAEGFQGTITIPFVGEVSFVQAVKGLLSYWLGQLVSTVTGWFSAAVDIGKKILEKIVQGMWDNWEQFKGNILSFLSWVLAHLFSPIPEAQHAGAAIAQEILAGFASQRGAFVRGLRGELGGWMTGMGALTVPVTAGGALAAAGMGAAGATYSPTFNTTINTRMEEEEFYYRVQEVIRRMD